MYGGLNQFFLVQRRKVTSETHLMDKTYARKSQETVLGDKN